MRPFVVRRKTIVTIHTRLSGLLLAALERKISMRQSREELIKRGVLKEIYDKGKRPCMVHRPSEVYRFTSGSTFCYLHHVIRTEHLKPAGSGGKRRWQKVLKASM